MKVDGSVLDYVSNFNNEQNFGKEEGRKKVKH